MVLYKLVVILFLMIARDSEPAKILGVFPFPSISHQVVFRSVMIELAKRGHEVTVITPNPKFINEQAPANYTEIDVHNVSYTLWYKLFEEHGNHDTILKSIKFVPPHLTKIFEAQCNTPEVQKLINGNNKFDLIFVEALIRPALGFSHIYKVPVVAFSSLAGIWGIYDVTGAATHPLLYPEPQRYKVYNLTIWEKLSELLLYFNLHYLIGSYLPSEDQALKRIFGPDTPRVKELERNIEMLYLNAYPMWDNNRPVPPNVIYLGGLHLSPENELPQDLKSYLDSSKNGVIYFSLGTNVMMSMFPPEKLKIFTDAFAKVPYDVLFKWDKDELPGRSDNVKTFKWLPQSDVLRHPNVKLFITQAGLQSTDEALTAGVPLLAIPMLGDQWYNGDQYVRFGIGKRIDFNVLTEDELRNAIVTVIEDKSYRENIISLRRKLRDNPQSSMDRAVWWTEYLLRQGGATHLRAPAAFMTWTEYYDLHLVSVVLGVVSICLILVISLIYYVILKFRKSSDKIKKN